MRVHNKHFHKTFLVVPHGNCLITMEPLFSRYSLQLTETELVLSFGAGVCSPEDTDICLVFLYILEDAVFPLPVVYPNGTIVWPEGNDTTPTMP